VYLENQYAITAQDIFVIILHDLVRHVSQNLVRRFDGLLTPLGPGCQSLATEVVVGAAAAAGVGECRIDDLLSAALNGCLAVTFYKVLHVIDALGRCGSGGLSARRYVVTPRTASDESKLPCVEQSANRLGVGCCSLSRLFLNRSSELLISSIAPVTDVIVQYQHIHRSEIELLL